MKHKTALVTSASIVGVVLAGAIAMGANLGILASTDTADLSAATPVDPAPSQDVVLDQPPMASTAEPVAYEIPGVGVVTLLREDSFLRVSTIDLAAGWSWDLERDGEVVSLRLINGSGVLRFQADALSNDVNVSVTQEQITPSVPLAATGVSGFQDDDWYEDDDRYEDHERHEDDDRYQDDDEDD